MTREHGFAGFRAYPSDRFGGRATFSYSRGGAVTVLEPPGGAFAPKLAGLRQIAPTEVDGANACNACIDCDALRSASVFITFEGFLLPCCYVGGWHYTHRHRGPVPADADIAAIFESFDMTVLDIEAVGFWAALQGYAAFMDHLGEHWPGQGPKVCKAVCGRRRTAAAETA